MLMYIAHKIHKVPHASCKLVRKPYCITILAITYDIHIPLVLLVNNSKFASNLGFYLAIFIEHKSYAIHIYVPCKMSIK